MDLTSINRVRNYLSVFSDGQRESLEDAQSIDDEIQNWISSLSSLIEDYLDRSILIQSRTEYFKSSIYKKSYFLKARPISSITSVKDDSTGLFTGNETTLGTDEYYIGPESNKIVLRDPVGHNTARGLQVVYTGGLAYHATRTVMTVSDGNNWTTDKYVRGTTSNAIGIIVSINGTTLTVDVLSGIFVSGETIEEHSLETGPSSLPEDGTATISSIDQQSLAESHPAITRAVEVEIMHFWKRKNNLDNTAIGPDGSVEFRGVGTAMYKLQPETRALLRPYRVPAIA
jgi:hypothetical protein